MHIVIEEMKKILTGRKLLLLLGFAVLYHLLFLRPFVNIYSGSYQQEADIAKALISRYGTILSGEAWTALEQERPRGGKGEIDRMIREDPDFAAFGIYTFQEFNNRMAELTEADSTALWMKIYEQFDDREVSEEMTAMLELNIFDFFLESYQTESSQPEGSSSWYSKTDGAQRERISQRNQREMMGLMPPGVFWDNLEILKFLSVFMLLSVIFVIVPYMVKENRSRLPAIQYSTKRGRRIFGYKCLAVLLSACVVLGANLLWYGGIAKINRVFDFWNCPAASCTSEFIGWFPWSIGTLTLAALGISIAAGLGMALLVFVVTARMSNFIAAIAWQLPLAVASGVFGGYCMLSFTEITTNKYLAVGAALGALILGALAAGGRLIWERRRDC